MSGLLINPYRFAAAIQHVADANARLSLTGISVGKHVIQDDNSVEYVYNGDAEAVQIIGAGTEAANGYYTKRGTLNGKGYFILIGQATPATFANGDPGTVSWDSGNAEWRIIGVGFQQYYNSADAVASPWLATFAVWGDGTGPAPTTAHIASKNALTTCAFVSGAGTTAANGIYTERGMVNGKIFYNLLGASTDSSMSSIMWTGSQWRIYDSGGNLLYSASDDVAHPWTVGSWNSDDGTHPAPTVVSKTQGSLDEGAMISGASTPDANDIFLVSSPANGRNGYIGIAHAMPLAWSGSAWQVNSTDPSSADDTAFPSTATFNDSATIVTDPIACDLNWEPI